MERQFTEQELIRREKAEKLREAGLDPFGDRYDRDSFAADLKEKYATISHEEFENMTDTATVAERIMGFSHSKINECCRGKRKSHKGYKWMYLEDYEKLNE